MKAAKKTHPIPGLTRKEEEAQLARNIRVAQKNLTRTETYIRQLTDELDDLRYRKTDVTCCAVRKHGKNHTLGELILKILSKSRQNLIILGGQAFQTVMHIRW